MTDGNKIHSYSVVKMYFKISEKQMLSDIFNIYIINCIFQHSNTVRIHKE